MKKIAGVALIMFCCFAATAQTDLKKKIVDSTCACLSEVPDISKKSQEELQVLIGQCRMKKSMVDFLALAAERNVDLSDMDAMQKLATEIGMDLAKADCKAMNDLMMKMAQSQLSGGTQKTDDVIKEPRMIKGTVQNVEVKDFVMEAIWNKVCSFTGADSSNFLIP